MDSRTGAELLKRKRADGSQSYRAEEFKDIITAPVMLCWSDGTRTETTAEQAFTTEEDYSRYQSYKESGKAYPVRVEAPEGAEDAIKTLCEGLTAALERYVIKGAEI